MGAQTGLKTISVPVADGHVQVAIEGHGLPLILLHGWTLDHRMWCPQLPLAETFQLIMLDRRGFGGSDAVPAVAQEHEDVLRVMDHLKIERAALLGHSQGGSVALDTARRHPRRITAVAAFGAPLHGVVPATDRMKPLHLADFIAQARSGDLAAMKAQWRKHPLMDMSQEAAEMLAPILQAYGGRDLMLDNPPIALSLDDIQTLPMPLLAATGEKDCTWRRAVAEWLGAHAPKGQSTLIQGGHMCNVEAADQFNIILTEFLNAAHSGVVRSSTF